MAGTVGTNEFGLDAEFFTGTKKEDRGESLVTRHLNALQTEKENTSIAQLEALMPQMGAQARLLLSVSFCLVPCKCPWPPACK